MFKNKYILIQKLTRLNFIFLRILTKLGYQVYFFTIDNSLDNNDFFEQCYKKKIYHLSKYHAEDYEAFEYVATRPKILIEKSIEKFFDDNILNFTGLAFALKSEEDLKKLKILIFSYIRPSIRFIELMYVISDLNKKKLSYVLFYNFNTKEKILLEANNIKVKNINLNFINFFKMPYKIFKAILKKFKNSLAAKLKSKIQLNNKNVKINSKAVYFPHKSIDYGPLYQKDNFYSEKKNNILNKSNIYHIDFCDDDNARIELSKSYEKYDLKYQIVNDNLDFFFIDSMKFFFNNIKLLKNYKTFVILFKIYHKLKKYNFLLNNFSNLKIALVGYDINFDPILSYALQKKGVKVVACQERFSATFWKNQSLIFDLYYVNGEIVKQELLKNDFVHIDEYKVIGIPRTDTLFEFCKNKQTTENKKKNVLVFAYSIENNTGQTLDVNAHNIKIFLNNIIKLAEQFEDHKFVIRVKNIFFLKSSIFNETFSKIEELPNIVIDKDYSEFYYSYKLIANSDIVISASSSVIEECLVVNKPIIIYDFYPNMNLSKLFNYDCSELFSHSYFDLQDKLGKFLRGKNFYKNEENFKKFHNFFDPNFLGKVKKNLRLHLEDYLQNHDFG